jgi:DNA-binding phage protein
MRKFRPLNIPSKAHPLVRRMFEEMNYQRIGVLDMSDKTGVNKNTINDWKNRSNPQVQNLEACFTALGLQLTLRRGIDV